MASTARLSSPTSLQLRFGPRCRESSSVFLRIRFRPSDRRRRIRVLVSAVGPTERGGAKGQSWAGNNGSPDFFAGWSDPESGGGGDPQRKGPFGGMLGAGLAGAFFVAGVTFASLSLSNRTTSGVKHQLEPLTNEQEVLLSSDDQSEKVNQPSNESDAVLPDKESKISETGINKDSFPPLEINEDATESRLDHIHHSERSSILILKPNGNDVDAIPGDSSEDNLQIGPDVDNIQPPSDSNPSLHELSVQDIVGFPSDGSGFKVSNSTQDSGTPDSVVRYDANVGIVNHVDSSSLGIDSTDDTTGYAEENSSPAESLFGFSNELEGQPSKGDIVDSQINTRVVAETAAPVSKEQNVELSNVLQLPADASVLNTTVRDALRIVPSSTLSGSDFDQNEALAHTSESFNSAAGRGLHEKGPSIAYSVSQFADSNLNEPNISSNSQTSGGFTLESLSPEKSFSYAGIPAPSLVSADLQVPPGKVLIPAVVDQAQGQALASLQVLKVIEADVQPGDLCTRREYARWLVSASSALSRNTTSKVYPAMYIENVTELAFDDVTPNDPDFSFIQGLAEAGIISSKLSRSDLNGFSSGEQDSFLFSPESPVSRQDLVSWKMALEKRTLPEVDKNYLYQYSGFIDTDKINPDACPALVADLAAGDQGIIALAFGFTRLFQPNKPVTKAQAAIALATGDAAEVVNEELTRIEAESLADTAVNAHTALVAQVEKDLNASFERELAKEREKLDALEKVAEEARLELERLRAEREEGNDALNRGRAAVESEMEVLSRLRCEIEEQLQDLMSNKMEISFERDRINKLRQEAEGENQVIVRLQYELEVERKALTMARAWAEEEAKKAREQARALEEARDRWERHGIKVVVDEDLQDHASPGITWLTAGRQPQVDETINRAENLVDKLKAMAAEMKVKSSIGIEKIIQKIIALMSALKQRASGASKHTVELCNKVFSKASRSIEEIKENASGVSSSISDRARRAVEDCKESVEKLTQKFKT